jgi:ATP-binding cassette subfamily C (CFTR/MRP) protein 1
LTVDDLFPLDQRMRSETLQQRLLNEIEVSGKKEKNNHLARALAKALAVPLLLPIGPRVALIAFRFGYVSWSSSCSNS